MADSRGARVAHYALGAAGLIAAAVMARHSDVGALRAFGPWAVFVVVVEGARVVAEALATRALVGGSVPWGPLLRAHAAGYALAMTMPAGRSVAEAAKATVLAPWIGAGRSVGVAATNQSLVMASTGAVALACAVPAAALGHANLARAVVLQGVALVAFGGALLATVRSPAVAAWVGAKLPRLAAMAGGASEGARAPGVPRAAWWFAAHRIVQGAQLFAMLAAIGRPDPVVAAALLGASIIGTSVGVAVPGQLGAVGASLALAAPGLGVSAAVALSMALVIHAAQLAWVIVGLAVWTVARRSSVTVE